MKKFKNSFGVKGSPSLLQALKEEAEKLGWKYDSNFNSGYSEDNPDLYFNANEPKDDMKPQHFSFSNVGISFSNVGTCIIYNLPEQWDECLKAASELEEEVPEYVEFIYDNISYFTKGTIYPLNKNGNCQGDNGEYYRAMQYPKDKKFMVPSTKEAYEKQQEKFKMQELIKEAEKRYPVGTEFELLEVENKTTLVKGTPYFNEGDNTIWNYGGYGRIYANGKWAKILKPVKEEFVLPKKWCIRQDISVKVCNWFAKHEATDSAHINGRCIYLCFNEEEQYTTFENTLKEYTEITLEQFNKYVLKEEPMEIAGYSVKFEDDKVSVGCYKDITLKQLKTLRKAIKIVNDLGNDLTITEDGIIEHRDDNQISLEEIEELIKRLNG